MWYPGICPCNGITLSLVRKTLNLLRKKSEYKMQADKNEFLSWAVTMLPTTTIIFRHCHQGDVRWQRVWKRDNQGGAPPHITPGNLFFLHAEKPSPSLHIISTITSRMIVRASQHYDRVERNNWRTSLHHLLQYFLCNLQKNTHVHHHLYHTL